MIRNWYNQIPHPVLLKRVTMESRSASSSSSVARGANLSPIVASKAFITVGSFSFSRSNLILGWLCFLEFLKACLESHHHHLMVVSNICTWECSDACSLNTWTEPFLRYCLFVALFLFCLSSSRVSINRIVCRKCCCPSVSVSQFLHFLVLWGC